MRWHIHYYNNKNYHGYMYRECRCGKILVTDTIGWNVILQEMEINAPWMPQLFTKERTVQRFELEARFCIWDRHMAKAERDNERLKKRVMKLAEEHRSGGC